MSRAAVRRFPTAASCAPAHAPPGRARQRRPPAARQPPRHDDGWWGTDESGEEPRCARRRTRPAPGRGGTPLDERVLAGGELPVGWPDLSVWQTPAPQKAAAPRRHTPAAWALGGRPP